MAYVAAATECLLEIFLIPDIFNFPLDETFPLGFSPDSLPIKFIQPGIYPFMNFLAAASLGPPKGDWPEGRRIYNREKSRWVRISYGEIF